MTEAMTKTEEEFYILILKGEQCPACASKHLHAGNLHSHCCNPNGSHVWRNVRCGNCGKEWADIYTLTGVGQPR